MTDHITNSNGAICLGAFLTNFAITQRLSASLVVSVALFFLGKFLDYLVKPALDDWRAKRKKRASK
ncbi:MAG: hypothetical protein WCF57_20200 [Pyrinomonadaceae bacterium]